WLVEGIGGDSVPPVADFSRVSGTYSIPDAEAFRTCRELLAREGIIAGTSTGTLLAAALRYCREQQRPRRVVTFVCDSGNKYLSKVYNDYWMLDQGFIERERRGDLRDLIARPHAEHAAVTVNSTETVMAAYRRMKLYDVSQVPVTHEGRIVGIVDEEDILLGGVAKPGQRFATRVIHGGQRPDPLTGAVMPPIYATSTYVQSSPGVHQGYEYSRTRNPTRDALQAAVASLEGGAAGFAFASGMAATATVLELLDAGSHIVAMHDLYGGSYRLLENVRSRSAGHRVSFVDLSDPAALTGALRPDTRMVWVETPTNPLLKLVDLSAVASLARSRALLSVCDNTFASPFIQRPLEHGFDIVVHSTTKYLNGHSDAIGGAAIVRGGSDLAERIAYLQNAVGAVPGPFDAFLTLRGIKTLALRMERHCANALAIAQFL